MRSCLSVFAFACALHAALPAQAESHFAQTLQRHLDAIDRRDSSALFDTVPDSGKLTLILPNGRLSDSAQQYREAMRDWLSETDWKWTYQIVTQAQRGAVGWATLKVGYDDVDEARQPYHLDYYLTLLFERRGKRWLLVHDQNTRIPPAK
ncbi:nuclear transport factor 2 family protein [Chitinimonas sp.]|uniref:YybH family protein n=1 Tax=Chitinimonas sp. TaxID=1934313 RepID=UPI0035B311D8